MEGINKIYRIEGRGVTGKHEIMKYMRKAWKNFGGERQGRVSRGGLKRGGQRKAGEEFWRGLVGLMGLGRAEGGGADGLKLKDEFRGVLS